MVPLLRIRVCYDHQSHFGGSMAIGIGATLNERFLLDKELGRGGMGAVFSAVDQILQRRVAIKVLKEQSGEEVGRRLRLEAQILARLLHDNIVRLYDFGQTQGMYYLIMEEVDGSSYNKRWRQLPMIVRLQTLAGVADALHYAHQQGVIHRDVKSANVLLTLANQPKLSDFGLSTIVDQGDETGIVRGTPHYMSPEQAKGRRLDHRSDLYSLGVMLYESATGSMPFSGTPMSIMAQHVSTEPQPARAREPRVSPELDALIGSLLAKSPEKRPISGDVVAQAIREEVERLRLTEQAEATTPGPSLSPATGSEVAPADAALAANPPSSQLQTEGARLSAPIIPSDSDSGRNGQAVSAPAPGPEVQLPTQTQVAPASSVGSGVGTANGSSAGPSRISGTGTRGVLGLVSDRSVRKMLEVVLAEPLILSPDERYLHGHYLAYLLGGARRKGIFLRRPLDPRNADRARLLLGMTYVMNATDPDAAAAEAATLLDAKTDVRAALNPIVVAKYLASRDTPARRKAFRQYRGIIQRTSSYAQKKMVDSKGVLNPGLMPQNLDDLRKIAPPRTEVDDVLVERWNRVADLWRENPDFRRAVLRYTSGKASRDPASQVLWPEVIYPLIELGRFQRRSRSRAEAAWDFLRGRVIRLPDAGVLLDRMIKRVMPARVIKQLDDSLELMVEHYPVIEGDDDSPKESRQLTLEPADADSAKISAMRLEVLTAQEDEASDLIRLVEPDPIRFNQGELHELWKEALKNLQAVRPGGPGVKIQAGHQPTPVGPYRLVVIPSIRGRAAGQVAIQGMNNKQIELTTPAIRTRGSAGKPLIAVWVYEDGSLAIAHLDFQNSERYVLWDAPRGHELKFGDPGDLNHELVSRNLESPHHIGYALSRRFKPQNPG